MKALVIAAMMIMGTTSLPTFAADKTVTVTVDANGGYFDGQATHTTHTETVTVDSGDTTVDFGLLRGVPAITAPDSTHAFDFWADSASATAENLKATITNNAATFYAVWKEVPTGNRELDGKITVSGLEAGDAVNFYKILKWSQDAVDTKGWVAADGFDGAGGLTADEIKTILNIGAPTNPGISSELAAKLASLAKNLTPTAGYGSINAANGAASKADPDAGLYMALITPGQPDVIYNPVFVSADHDGNETNSWALVNLETSYSPTSYEGVGEDLTGMHFSNEKEINHLREEAGENEIQVQVYKPDMLDVFKMDISRLGEDGNDSGTMDMDALIRETVESIKN